MIINIFRIKFFLYYFYKWYEKTYTKIYQTKDDETLVILELIIDENTDLQRDVETNELNKKIREEESFLLFQQY